MDKKLTKEQIELLKVKALLPSFYKTIDEYVTDEELKGKLEPALNGDFDDKTCEELIEKVCLNFVKQFSDSVDIEYIAKTIVDEELKLGIAKALIRNQDELDYELTPDQLVDLAVMVEDEEFIQECLDKADEYHFDYFGKSILDSEIYYIQNPIFEDEPTAEDLLEIEEEFEDLEDFEDIEEELGGGPDGSISDDKDRKLIWLEADGTFDKASFKPVIFFDDPSKKPLDYTEAEKFAIRTYEGVAPGGGPIGKDIDAYKTMNAMLFPGIGNEMERIFDDRARFCTAAIYQADELMERSVDLFSVMYKYGKRMPYDQQGYRVDRASAAKLIAETGRTVSNFSTSTTGYKRFAKADIALVHAVIEQGTPCADFKAILGEDGYELGDEAEILVAPMCPVEVLEERAPQTASELKMKNSRMKPASRVYEMRISPLEKAEPLTEEEQQDYEEKQKIFESEEHRENAARFLAKLNYLRRDGFSKEEVMYIMDQDDLAMYLEWKEAYQSVYRYKTRERMLEIDRQIEEAERNGTPLYTEEPVQDMGEGNKLEISKIIVEKGINEIEEKTNKEIIPEKEEATEDEELFGDGGHQIGIDELDSLAEGRMIDINQKKIKSMQGFIGKLLHKDKNKNEIDLDKKDDTEK